MENLKNLQQFENRPIRTAWDEEKEEWLFSVVDVVGALTDQPDNHGAARYWGMLKTRLKEEGSQLSTFCGQLKLESPKDGKKYLTDVATTKQLLRIIQSCYFNRRNDQGLVGYDHPLLPKTNKLPKPAEKSPVTLEKPLKKLPAVQSLQKKTPLPPAKFSQNYWTTSCPQKHNFYFRHQNSYVII